VTEPAARAPASTAPQPEAVLARLGIPPDAEVVWRLLMTSPSADIAQLSRQSGLTHPAVVAAIETLTTEQLVRTAASPTGVLAIDPSLAVETHILRAERQLAATAADLAAMRVRIPELASDYARGRAASGEEPGFEIIVPIEEIKRQIWLGSDRTVSLHRNLVHTQTAEGLRDAKHSDEDSLRRGVVHRTIVGPRELTDPDFFGELANLHRLGESVRTHPEIPTRLIIFDRHLAILPVDPANMDLGAMFIRVRSVVDLLIFMFDQMWSVADPVFDAPAGATPTAERHARVVELLAVGTKDERMARTLGVGVRTVRRDIADLKTTLGVSSRTEIVAAAIRKGWL
jgi:DNA-binding CsgD family transcriptional regulator